MPILVGLHLREAEDGVLALAAVVVGLLAVVDAAAAPAELGGRVFLKARSHYGIHLLMLLAVGNHLVGVRAVLVALQAVEVRRALLVGA